MANPPPPRPFALRPPTLEELPTIIGGLRKPAIAAAVNTCDLVDLAKEFRDLKVCRSPAFASFPFSSSGHRRLGTNTTQTFGRRSLCALCFFGSIQLLIFVVLPQDMREIHARTHVLYGTLPDVLKTELLASDFNGKCLLPLQ